MLHICSTPSSGSLLGVVEEIKMQRYHPASSDTVPTWCLKFKLPTQSSKSNGHRSQTNKPEGGYGINVFDQFAAREEK